MSEKNFAIRPTDPEGMLVVEGHAGVGFSGLKNIIVTEMAIRNLAQFMETFQKIKDRLLGGQRMPVKKVVLDEVEEGGWSSQKLAHFRDIYSNILFSEWLGLIYLF